MRYILFALALTLFTALHADALYNRGETLYYLKSCSSCHGPDAEGSSLVPKLANKSEKYIFKKLEYFKKGKVSTQSQEMMSQFIQKLTKEDMQALSRFLSKHQKIEQEDLDDSLLGGFGS